MKEYEVDKICWSENDESELIEYIDEMHSGNHEKKHVIIHHSGDKETKKIAETISKDLEKQLGIHVEPKKKGEGLPIGKSKRDYTITVKLVSQKEEPTISGNMIYAKFGIFFVQERNALGIYINPEPKLSDAERSAFVTYYQSCTERFIRSQEKELEAFEHWAIKHKTDPVNSKVAEKVISKIPMLKSLDWLDDKPDIVQILGIPLYLVEAVVETAGIVLVGFSGIGEALIKLTLEGLQNSKFDKKHVFSAQQQIAEMKLFELFKAEMLKQKRIVQNKTVTFEDL